MHGFVRKLLTEWRQLDLPFSGETLVVAVSGGADSVSLLLAINDLSKRKKIEHRIIVAHLDHGLRGSESDADELFVRELATILDLEFVCERGKVEKKGNLEQNARNARYEFFRRMAIRNDASIILTGHTMTDQAETFLLNLIRGSGIDGLSAIPSTRPFEISDSRSEIELVRPLLKWATRSDTESFCSEIGVEYRHDSMNEDLAFKRVRIRKELIPLLATMNPKIVETLAATAGLMSGRNGVIRINVTNELKISELRKLGEAELFETLRKWLGQHRGNTRGLGLKHIKAVAQLIFSEKSGRIAELPGGNALKSGGKLRYQKN